MKSKGDKEGWAERLLRFLKRSKEAQAESDESSEASSEMQEELLQGVQEFQSTIVREVMVPRTEIQAVASTDSQEDAVEKVLSSGFSRIPVFRESIDHIEGIVHAKDLLRCIRDDCADKPLPTIMREPYFIPETKKVDQLLADFLAQHVQIAIVLDEYGGTEGLVTLEDLIEEIIGEIADEYDSEVIELTPVSKDELHANARVEISEVEDYFEVELPDGDYTTVGGWITENTGHIPAKGEQIDLDGFRVKVESADDRRVGLVRIVRQHANEDEDEPRSPD